jgi:subfamily B ATP-binding cassette protein HlyB/CyaB
LVARLHQVAAEPAALRHALGMAASDTIAIDDVLHAARHLGLKARHSRSTAERLNLAPLPALARLHDGRWVVLAQCDGQRVLFQDASAEGSRPTIEPLDTFAAQWTGDLLLIASRASLAGELARFDFSWFVPALVKYRRLFSEALVVRLFLGLNQRLILHSRTHRSAWTGGNPMV